MTDLLLPPQDHSGAQASQGIDLPEILRILSRQRVVILSVVASFVTLSLLLAFQLKPLYTAEAVLMLDIRKNQVVDVESVLSGLPPDAAVVRSELDVLRSRQLASKVVDRLGLAADPEFNPVLPQAPSIWDWISPLAWIPASWRLALAGNPPPPGPDVQADLIRAAIIDRVIAGLAADNDGRSYSIRLSFTASTAVKAMRIANGYAESYLTDQLEAKFEATKRANDWLSNRLAELRDQVRAAENAVQQYREANNLIQSRGATISAQQLSEINSQLVLARAERSQAEARLRAAQRVASGGDTIDSAVEVLASPLIQRLREQESQVRRREAELSNRYGARHPTMINVRAELQDLRQKIAEEVRRIIQGLANEVEVAKAKESSLRAALDDLQGATGSNARAEVRLRELERESEAGRVLYENFLNRYKETSEQQDLQSADARLISPAVMPLGPSFPKKSMVLALGTAAGLALGLLAAFMLERLDRGFRGAEQVEGALALPVLAQVPALNERATKQKPEQYVLDKPLSSFSEALRSLRTALHYTNVDDPPKVIVITSTVPREGKSTLSLCFARATARAGSRVLLIDADFRRPRITKMAAVPAAATLSDMLAGSHEVNDAIQVDALSGAHLIAAAPGTPNPQDLLASKQMERFVDQARALYDLIIIDTPPVLAVSDALAVSKVADALLYVVHWGSTAREMVATGIKQLRACNAPLAGVVLSQVDLRKHARYGYGDYGYYYGRYREYYKN
ncbi:polysaccharide biosynthesis tyrosine autokinase [Oleisolibacter albus]|uniref:polysaccharide biosynthesis tyrosine autokinase n=1 Tax=Oleisolibacter albus TaxID=2171757 RepID=UPI00138FF58C|nr:polysaccharide biosynthesis tyrosine autokinase [Oleisolibacter albus]